MSEEKKDSDWVRAAPNLVRYVPSGTYYLRGRFGGTPYKESLDTDSFASALILRDDRLRELRAANPRRTQMKTLADALAVVRAQVKNNPTLKEDSKQTYYGWIDALAPGGSAPLPSKPLRRLSATDMEEWWGTTAAGRAPTWANSLFMVARRAIRTARKAGAMSRDPMEEMERLDVPPTELTLPTVEQLQVLLADIRSRSTEAADWLEFMAYSGLRPAEVEALQWEHIGETSIAVHGGPTRTKNRRIRHVPIVPAMAALLERLRGPFRRTGAVFSIGRPKALFRESCARLHLPAMRIYDLRHLFATVCVQSGTDPATLARWLGHQDKGVLVLKVYTHPTTEHQRQAAAKVKF